MAETRENTGPLRVESGACIVHRLFDVADSIDLGLAEELWLAAAGQPTRRTHLSRASANELAYEVPPTLLVLPKLEIEVDSVALQANVTARLYDFGVIALALRFDASGLTWDAFAAHCNQVDLATGARQESALWQATLRGVLDVIAPALNKPSVLHLEEDYLFAVVHRFGEPMTGVQVHRASILRNGCRGTGRAVPPGTGGTDAPVVFLHGRRSRRADLGPRLHPRSAR